MKNIITTAILTIIVCINSYGQTVSSLQNKRLPVSTKTYGAYTLTTDNGKMTVTKKPYYDASKDIKRDTTSKRYKSSVEIYVADAIVLINYGKI